MTGSATVNTLSIEAGGPCTSLEEGRRGSKKSLPPLQDGPGRSASNTVTSAKAVLGGSKRWSATDLCSTSPEHELALSPGSSVCPANTRSALTGPSSEADRAHLMGNGVGHDGGQDQKGAHARDETAHDTRGSREALSKDEGLPGTPDDAKDDEKDSAQRVLIGWVQARQRECVTLISLGCVTATFVEHLRSGRSGTLGFAIVFIPVTVNVLLMRDVYLKWDTRRHCRKLRGLPERKSDRKYSALQKGASFGGTTVCGGAGSTVDGSTGATDPADRSLEDPTTPAQRHLGGDECPPPLRKTASMGSSRLQGDDRSKKGNEGADSTGFYESLSSSNQSCADDAGRTTRSSSNNGPANDDDSWSTNPGRKDENLLSYLETPYQKSVRLLCTASDGVNDPVIKRQLTRVATLLSDPDALHVVKEGAIRRVATDSGTLSYIENVLQTPVKGSSAESNWNKLRAGMYVVRSMAKEAAEEAVRAKGGQGSAANGASAEAPGANGKVLEAKSDLDALLDDLAHGIEAVASPTDESSGLTSDLKEWDNGDAASFGQLNRSVIVGQQLVAKALSRGDLRKDLDRVSIRELHDVLSDRKVPGKILENSPREDGADLGVSAAEMRRSPRLPLLDEGRMETVRALMAGEQFLKWDFNVFSLDEVSGGHSLWYTAMSTFSYYNLIGAFGLNADRLSQLFLRVEATYCHDPAKPNTYHTHVHAADVTLTVAHFLSVDVIANAVRSAHGVALLMAAIMHDYRHPGVNNGYLVRDLDPLAVTYNDSSVLENFHAAEGFKLMLSQKFDIFKGWKAEDVKVFRQAYVKCILATDLALSLEYISKFGIFIQNIDFTGREGRGWTRGGSSSSGVGDGMTSSTGGGNGGQGFNGKERSGGKGSGVSSESTQNQTLLLQMILKVADVAHPCKPWEIHRRWSDLITEEFFKQGDMEAAQGLTVSPLCNRLDQNLPKSQCDFIDFIVRPCVTIFSTFCRVQTWNSQLEANYRAWKVLYDQQGGRPKTSTPGNGKRRSLR